MIPRALAAPFVCACACCATPTTATTRELPVGLSSLGTLLDGCNQESGADAVVRMKCEGDVVLALRSRTAGVGEALFRGEAYTMAQSASGRLVWDQVVVATEGPSGVVDRARALAPGTDALLGVVLGVIRSTSQSEVQEIWCAAKDDPGESRCRALVGAVLSKSISIAAASVPTGVKAGPANVFGRSLSLPTQCKAVITEDGGTCTCEDGATLTWRRYQEMADATDAVQATFMALNDDVEPQPFACTIAGEPGQCEDHTRALAGLVYLDGKPVAVLCIGVDDPRKHSLCRAVIFAR